jgi:hypothetical protein
MWQQGQVFKLKAKGRDGQPLWAYRYRLEGRGSVRPLAPREDDRDARRCQARGSLTEGRVRVAPNDPGRA